MANHFQNMEISKIYSKEYKERFDWRQALELLTGEDRVRLVLKM